MTRVKATYFLIIDLGTSSVRSSIFNSSGEIISSMAEEYPIIHPQVDWAEQDPNLWWSKIITTVKNVISKTQLNKEIIAISVTSQREGLVPVDKNCNPLSNCIIWMDKRTTNEYRKIDNLIGQEKIYEITGLRLDPSFSACKLLWIKKIQPEVFTNAYKFLQAEDFILSKLTGQFITEPSIASRTMLLDVKRRNWSEELFNKLQLPMEKMPKLIESGQVIGTLLPEVAQEINLSRKTKIITGGGDQQCTAIGVGALKEGIVSVSIGTASVVSMTINAPRLDPKRNILCCCAALPNKWELEPPIWTTGVLLKWFRDEFYPVSYNIISEEATKVGIGADKLITLPYFMGAGSPHWDSSARGAIIGLTLGHKKAHLIRSLMESVAYEIRLNIEEIENLGIKVDRVILSGGGSKSQFWCQMIADCLNKEIVLPEISEAASSGAAILAGVGSGIYNSIEDASSVMIKIKKTLHPDRLKHEKYSKIYQIYNDAYASLKDIYYKMERI